METFMGSNTQETVESSPCLFDGGSMLDQVVQIATKLGRPPPAKQHDVSHSSWGCADIEICVSKLRPQKSYINSLHHASWHPNFWGPHQTDSFEVSEETVSSGALSCSQKKLKTWRWIDTDYLSSYEVPSWN